VRFDTPLYVPNTEELVELRIEIDFYTYVPIRLLDSTREDPWNIGIVGVMISGNAFS